MCAQAKEIRMSRNGIDLGVMYTDVNFNGIAYPCVSIAKGQVISFNLGALLLIC